METDFFFRNHGRSSEEYLESEFSTDALPLFDNSSSNKDTEERGITFHWRNVSVRTTPGGSHWRRFTRRTPSAINTKEILQNVNGLVRPGELLAIMGASGAGKTTLLNILTSRRGDGLEVSGSVFVNGFPIEPQQLTAISAYVQQNDMFIGSLTVREHLIFQALLRMEDHFSYKRRIERVEEVIRELGLISCQNTLIGIPGRVPGISGGEKRRLAFASEVLTDPPLLLCDEPTSGLDSFMAQNVLDLLRSLAAKGKTILFTIHQPSSHLFRMFDKILLLTEGRTAYLGEAKGAYDFFSRLKLPCPVNYNPADFYIQVLAVVPGDEVRCRQRIKFICDQFEKHQNLRDDSLQEYSESQSQVNFKEVDESPYKASWGNQFRALLWRSTLTVLREPILLKMRLIQTTVIAFLMGTVFWQQKLDDKGVTNINGALYYILINISFQNAFAVINVFCMELPIFLREHWSGMYRTDSYFLSKTMAELPAFLIIPMIFATISYWMIGLNPDPVRFIIACIIITLTANVVASFGYMISTLSSNITMALALSAPLIVPMMLFGGFFLNRQSIPWYLSWLQYVSWFTYGNEALVINQWGNIEHINCVYNKTCPRNGQVVLQVLGFRQEQFSVDLFMLCVLFVAYRLVSFLALCIRARRKK